MVVVCSSKYGNMTIISSGLCPSELAIIKGSHIDNFHQGNDE